MIAGRPSSIAATGTALQWMQDLHLLPSSYVERAAAFLLTVQRPDGSWEESPAVLKFDPPPLVRPGTPLGRTYATALAAGWMARLLGTRHDAVQRAAAYLRAQRADAWPADEPVEVVAPATAVLLMVDGPAAPVVAAGTAALSRVPAEAWTPDRQTTALLAFAGAGVRAEDPLVTAALQRLLACRRPDGGWASERGADGDVDLTLRAMAALLMFGVSTREPSAAVAASSIPR